MSKPTITVIIGEDGEPEIRVEGAKGAACLALTKELESALGDIKQRTLTQEYRQGATFQTAAAKQT